MLDLATKCDIHYQPPPEALETKASGRIILLDRRDYARFGRYVTREKRKVALLVKSLWRKQRETLNTTMIKQMIVEGGVTQELNDIWREMIIDFVKEDLTGVWIKNIDKAGSIIEEKVNRIETKQYAFNNVQTNIKAWVDDRGGKLIVDLTQAQYLSTHTMIQAQLTWGVTSPSLMAQMLKPTIGLTAKESLAVQKVIAALVEEGVSPTLIAKQASRYADFLHNNRAFRIARTEISNAYNFGQLNSIKQAMDEGYLPGVPEKEWIAGGQDPDDICTTNEDEGSIPIDQAFPSGDMHPTAHPQCECALGFSVRRN